jgi:hypothetical protein
MNYYKYELLFGSSFNDSDSNDFNLDSFGSGLNEEIKNNTIDFYQNSTLNSTPINIVSTHEPILQSKQNKERKSKIFKITRKKNRGKIKSQIPNKKKREKHDKYEVGNVLTKIQVHCFKFLINFINDLIKHAFQKKNHNIKKFKQISYAIKKNINRENIKELKATQIKVILQKEISLKGQKDKNYNKNNYDKINKLIENDSTLNWINDIFEMNYLEFLKKFYIDNNEKDITISKETKSFNDLLEKNKNDNKMKENLKRVGKNIYFKEDGRNSLQVFVVERIFNNI